MSEANMEALVGSYSLNDGERGDSICTAGAGQVWAAAPSDAGNHANGSALDAEPSLPSWCAKSIAGAQGK